MYSDPRAGNVLKYLAMVPPAAPTRIHDFGTLTSGLTASPTSANNVGTTTFDLPRIPQPYSHLTLRVTGTTTGGGGAGTALAAYFQYNFLRSLEITMNGGDKFISISGGDLYLLNKLQGGYRSGETQAQDVLSTAPGAGATANWDLTYQIRFSDPTLYPRLFSLLNAYEGHGVTSAQIRLDFGAMATFLSGDATATISNVQVQLSAETLDYSMLPGFGVPYVQETAFSRMELRTLITDAAAATTDLKTVLDRGLYVRGLLVVDLNAAGTATAANNITSLKLVHDMNNILINSQRVPHLQRNICDRYSNIFRAENFAYYIDLCPQREITQLINTLGMAQWELLVTCAAAGRIRITEVMYNIPIASIRTKNSNSIVGKAA